MQLYLNAGFGEPLGVQFLKTLPRRGFVGIRQDIPNSAVAEPLLREIADAHLHPVLLIGGGKMNSSPSTIAMLAEYVALIAQRLGLTGRKPALEIGNEPDIAPGYADHPEQFAEAVCLAHERVQAVSDRFLVVTGGISTTGRANLDYLKRAIEYGLPEDVVIGYHTYRTTRQPQEPLKGFLSRDAEFAELKRIAGGREIWNTEIGWHTAQSTIRFGPMKMCKRKIQFSDEQVADFAEREVHLNAAYGSLGLVWFQLNDGPTDNYEDRFGIRRLDGTWKPVADRLASLGPVI